MIIEQDQEQLLNAIAVHTKAAVRSIRLAWSRAWSRPRPAMEELQKPVFDVRFKPAGVHIVSGCLTVETDFTFLIAEQQGEFQVTMKDAESSEHAIVLIECRFEAQYSLHPEYTPSEAEVEAFRTANAVFNCWPYFREYVQNTTIRMSLPPPAVPFLRIVPKVERVVPQLPEAPTAPAVARKAPPRKRRATQ